MKHIYIILVFVFIGLSLNSCSDENDDFKGMDNAIISFKLTKDGTEYTGSIKNNIVTISLPENESLYGAAAKIELSENATMIPDPATISNWNQEFRFSIKAHNGESSIFTYSPVFTPIVSEVGDIQLTSQEEVDAFVSRTDFPSIINGNLVIGKTIGGVAGDTIRDISGLSRIKEIRNNLIINPTFAGGNLSDFDNLVKIGGLDIKSNKQIKTVHFGALKSIMSDVSVESTSLQTLSLPNLAKVSNTFKLTTNTLVQLDLSSLESIGGSLSLINNTALESLSLPKLVNIGGQFILNNYSKLKKCDIAKLQKCGVGIDLNSLTTLEELEFSGLTSCGALLKVYNSGAITILSFPALKESVGVDIANLGTLTSLLFDELESVHGDFKFQAWRSPMLFKLVVPKLKKVTGSIDLITTAGTNLYTIEQISMPKLEEVGSTIKIYVGYAPSRNTSLKTLDFSSLKKVGRIDITNQSLLSDFSSLTNLIPNITTNQWIVNGCKSNPTYQDMKDGKTSGS